MHTFIREWKQPSMKDKTRIALSASIIHWLRMHNDPIECRARGEHPDVEDCALCNLYYDGKCKGCPVYEATGETACKGTPYKSAMLAWHNLFDDLESIDLNPDVFESSISHWRRKSWKMVEFLKDLRNRM